MEKRDTYIELLKDLIKKLDLENNKSIEEALEIFLNTKSSRMDRIAAKETIVAILSKKLIKSKVMKKGLSKGEFGRIKDKLNGDINLDRNDKFYLIVKSIHEKYLKASQFYSFKGAVREVDKVLSGKLGDQGDALLNELLDAIVNYEVDLNKLIKIAELQHNEVKKAASKNKEMTKQINIIDQNFTKLVALIKKDFNKDPEIVLDKLMEFVNIENEFRDNLMNKNTKKSMKKEKTKMKLFGFSLKLKKKDKKENKKEEEKGLSKKTKGIIVGVLAGSIALTSAFFIGRSSKKGNAIIDEQSAISDTLDTNDVNTELEVFEVPEKNEVEVKVETEVKEVTSQVTVETPVKNVKPEVETITQIQNAVNNAASKVYSSWCKIPDNPYSQNDIVELIKCLNGLDSSISLSTADDMLVTIINKAFIPALNNAILETNSYSTYSIELSDLLINGQSGLTAVIDMESYFNGAMLNSGNVQAYTTYVDKALIDEYHIIKGETYKGMNVYNNSVAPEVRLLWSRLSIGTNAMLGTLGEEHSIIVENTLYSAKQLNDWSLYEYIATEAKKDLGESTKSYTK